MKYSLYINKFHGGINMENFNIFWEMLYYKVTFGLSLEELILKLNDKYSPKLLSQKNIKKLYTLADEVEIKGEYSQGFKEFVSSEYIKGNYISKASYFRSYKSIRRYWLVLGYIFNTPSNIYNIWQYLLEDSNISLDTTRKFVENMALCSDFLVVNEDNYVIPFDIKNGNYIISDF